ncbi:hypothetical protein RvY_06678-2 [Ramazzottius varieornatus]|uniref:Uncharacterized protein n=1 Tax=Ramazzottius varieornatus TaxID=947166 RepID=A0A1D1V2S5_RAMVA|nr:hypothetical protein RvY_06678-2 [Ramazzottius varieornatus]
MWLRESACSTGIAQVRRMSQAFSLLVSFKPTANQDLPSEWKVGCVYRCVNAILPLYVETLSCYWAECTETTTFSRIHPQTLCRYTGVKTPFCGGTKACAQTRYVGARQSRQTNSGGNAQVRRMATCTRTDRDSRRVARERSSRMEAEKRALGEKTMGFSL